MPPGRKLGGSSEGALLMRGSHPYKKIWYNVVKRITTPRTQEIAEKARREYLNYINEMSTSIKAAKIAKTQMNINAAKARENASSEWQKHRQEQKNRELRKLKNTLKANRNVITDPNLQKLYNGSAGFWIRQLFNREFNKGYIPGENRPEHNRDMEKVKKQLAEIMEINKRMKKETNSAIKIQQAARAMLERKQKAAKAAANAAEINKHKQMKKKTNAAIKIQKAARAMLERKRLNNEKRQKAARIAREAAHAAMIRERNRTRRAGKGRATYNYETVRAENERRQKERVNNTQAKAAVKAAVKAAMAPRKPNNKETIQIANALNNLINTVKSNVARERWQNAKRQLINARKNNKAVNEVLRNVSSN